MYYLYFKLRNLAIKIVNNCRIIYLIINLFFNIRFGCSIKNTTNLYFAEYQLYMDYNSTINLKTIL